jgi:copper chaperone
MEALKFKTNIKCSGCIAASTPYLNQAVGEDNWEVDIQNPNKILTVMPNSNVDSATVIKAVEQAGYKAELTT